MRARILLPLALIVLLAPASVSPALGKLKGRFVAVPTDADASLWGVKVFSAEDVRICGFEGVYISTVDGKAFKVRTIDEEVSFRVMFWLNRQKGYFAAKRGKKYELYTTTNGGRRFSRWKVEMPLPVKGITFLDTRRGWIVMGSKKEQDGAWRRTTDGGGNWGEPEAADFRTPARVLNGISAPGAERIWAVGSHVSVALVGDAAKSPLYKTRQGSVLFSKNRGATWEVQDAGNPRDTVLTDVDFVDDSVGWVVGDMGFIARTTDGGKTWKEFDCGIAARLLAVDAVSAELAFAVGADGAAIGTNDGGKTFVTIETKTDRDLRDCSFVDEKTGYAVGQRGTLLRYEKEY